MNDIGALVIARNEQSNIEACLRSLGFCRERVLVDSFSEDATVELALPWVDRLYQRTFTSYAQQKNWGLDRLTTAWVVIVDADERVPPELAAELEALARTAPADGFWIHRRNFFFGHEIRGAGWGRDRVLRFFRREMGRYDDVLVHEEVRMDPGARVARCRHRLLHYSYSDWEGTFARLLRYSTLGAAEAARRGRRAGALSVASGPAGRFLRQYLFQGGFRDGLAGWIVCSLSAVGVFLRRAKLATQPAVDRAPSRPEGTARAITRTIKGPALDGETSLDEAIPPPSRGPGPATRDQ